MKKFCIAIILLISSLATISITAKELKEHTLIKDLITKPAVSSRCEGLINKHNRYLEARQKIYIQLDLNKKLQKQNVSHSHEISTKLNRLHNLLLKESEHIANSLISIEQQIIRLGCPGITL